MREIWAWQTQRRFLVAHGVTAAVALVLCATPLFNLLGYEFSTAMALLMSVLVAPTTFAGLESRTRQVNGESASSEVASAVAEVGPLWLFVRLSLLNLALLLPPLLLITLNALRVQVCDYWGGLALYLLLPGITVLYATLTAMVAHGVSGGRERWRGLIYAGFILVSGAGGLAFIGLQPPIVVVNPYGGYFAGSIYDEALAVPFALLAYRALQLALIAGLVSAMELAYRLRSGGARRVSFELVSVCVVSLCAVVVGHVKHVELGYSIDRGDVIESLGGVYETEHFTLYYPAQGTWPERIEALADDHEFRYWQLTRFFESEPEGAHVVSFLYPDRETKGRLMGSRQTLVAKLWLGEMHLLLDGVGESALTHELAHLFTEPFGSGPLKLSSSYWVLPNMGWVEGIATAAQWNGEEMTPHGWAAALFALDMAPDLEAILSAGGFWSRQSRTVYTLTGSFVRWLVETRGIERFKKAYAHGDLEGAYDESIGDLVAQWRDFLKTIPIGEAEVALAGYYFDRPSIFGKVCARNIAERQRTVDSLRGAGRLDEAVAEMNRIVALDPGEPGHRQALMALLSQAGAYERAHEIASDLLALEGLGVVRTLQIRQDLGDLYWREGRLEDALLVFEGILGEPGQPMAMRRALRVRVRALLDPALREVMFSYFLEEGGLAEKLALLFEGRRKSECPVLSYIIGLRLMEARAYDGVVVELQSALASELSDPELVENARRVLGIAAYHAAQYDVSLEAFQWLAKESLLEGERAQAADWVERVRWKQGREEAKHAVNTTHRGGRASWRALAQATDVNVEPGATWRPGSKPWNFERVGAGCLDSEP
ncbi:MAG: hypothetical protein CO108_02095 [Deltaproteobacteria bacterium CG_4_9_14_3_um_filter_63_12]|nr:MAG: hypothetical protein CO108_02095 [Deltaproteobacteria bacterium CG_4_9_14_3_um_filter_63_12]